MAQVINVQKPPNMILRILWMYLFGWWLALAAYAVGVILTALIVTAPLGMAVIQKLGKIFSLYVENKYVIVTTGGQAYSMDDQTNYLLRLLYFYVIGWWVGGIVLFVGILLGATIIGLPFGFYLINRVGKVATLAS